MKDSMTHTFFNFFTAYLSDNDRWLLYYTVLQVSNVAHLNYFFMVKENSSTISHLKIQLTWNNSFGTQGIWLKFLLFLLLLFFWPRNQSFDFSDSVTSVKADISVVILSWVQPFIGSLWFSVSMLFKLRRIRCHKIPFFI